MMPMMIMREPNTMLVIVSGDIMGQLYSNKQKSWLKEWWWRMNAADGAPTNTGDEEIKTILSSTVFGRSCKLCPHGDVVLLVEKSAYSSGPEGIVSASAETRPITKHQPEDYCCRGG
jgi:hypothetical protein